MFAGHAIIYIGNKEDAAIDEDVLIEITDSEKPFLEIAFSTGGRRTYLTFRLADLIREAREN